MNGMVYYGYASHGKTKSTPRSVRANEQTLASSFKPTSVVALLERNYQTYCAQNSLLVEIRELVSWRKRNLMKIEHKSVPKGIS